MICTVVIPAHNAADYLAECLDSVLAQTDIALSEVELILYNDGSTDTSAELAASYAPRIEATLGRYAILGGSGPPSGAGSARNRCCESATSDTFVFLDADDVMRPSRLSRTIEMFASDPTADILGGSFDRIPSGATPRYEAFHARTTDADLATLVYAFRDNVVAQPTLACRRHIWEKVGGFREGVRVPEDAHFAYDAILAGARFRKIPPPSVTGYRFHAAMTSHSYSRGTLMRIRVEAFEKFVLRRPEWQNFSVWGANRDGKEFYKCLSPDAQRRVKCWGDINPRKIGQTLRERPVVHFSELTPPIALCVALDRGGEFEENLKGMGLRGGVDCFHLV